MTGEDRERFAEALLILADTFRANLTEHAAAGYWYALSDLPIAAVESGMRAALRWSRFMPRPVEIRYYAAAAAAPPYEIRFRGCWSCGAHGPCVAPCICAKCVDPECYDRWKTTRPDDYARWRQRQHLAPGELCSCPKCIAAPGCDAEQPA
jgi:hypothetical protein